MSFMDKFKKDNKAPAAPAEQKELTVEERLERAKKPGQDAMKMHPYYGGKIETVPKACIRTFDDYTRNTLDLAAVSMLRDLTALPAYSTK